MTGANSVLLGAPFLFILTWASGFPITASGWNLQNLSHFSGSGHHVVVIVSIYAAFVGAPWPTKNRPSRSSVSPCNAFIWAPCSVHWERALARA